MAVGKVPTLMDINWGQINQQQQLRNQQNLRDNIMLDIRNRLFQQKGKLNWDGRNLTYVPGTIEGDSIVNPLSEEEVWNMYVTEADNNGVKPDVSFYQNELLPYYKNLSSQNLSNQITDLANRGLEPKHFKKLYRENPAYAKAFDYSVTNQTNPEFQKELSAYRPDQTAGLGPAQWLGLTGAGGFGMHAASKWAPEGKWGRHIKAGLPLAAMIGGQYAARQLGATEEQLDKLNTAMTIGVPAYYGTRMLGPTITGKNRLLKNTIGAGTRKELISRANALGITIDPKSGVNDIRSSIADKFETTSQKEIKAKFKEKNIKIPKAKTFSADVVKRGRFTKAFKPKGRGKLGLALSLLYPLISGEADEWMSGTELAPEEGTPEDVNWKDSPYANI